MLAADCKLPPPKGAQSTEVIQMKGCYRVVSSSLSRFYETFYFYLFPYFFFVLSYLLTQELSPAKH
jgi:hypothetical protein